MYELKLTNFNGIETVDSRQVAEATGKSHKNLLQDIRTYCGYLGELNFQPTHFFIESTYTTEQNKAMPCYLVTRKGCEMIANKMTGQKGVAFTALYINAFHKMEQKIAKHYTELQELEIRARADRATAMRINAENRRLKMLLDHPNIKELSPESLAALGISRMQETIGQDLSYALPEVEKTYSATEVGQMLGVSANMIGKTANAYGLKTKAYGIFVIDKARHSSKQVTTFRYNMNGVSRLADILGVEAVIA